MDNASHTTNRDSGEVRALGRLVHRRKRQARLQGRRLLLAIAASLAVPYVTSWVLIAFGWPNHGAASMSTAFAAAGVSLVVWSYTALRAFYFGTRATESLLLERRLRTRRLSI